MEHQIINLISCIITTWMGLQYFSMFGEKTAYKKIIRIVIVACSFVISITGSAFVLYNSVLVLPVQLVALFLMSLLYDAKWVLKLLHTALYYSLLGLSEMFVGMLYNVLFGDFAESRENAYVYFICMMTSRLIAFFAVRFIRLFAKKQYFVDLKNMILLLPLPISTLINLFVLLKQLVYIVDNTAQSILLAVLCVLLVFANLCVFLFVDRMNDYTEKKTDLMLYEQEYKSQKQHLESLQDHLSETRAFRHDTKNEMLSLLGLLEANEIQKAKNAIRASLNMLDETGKDIVNTNHPVIDALLQNKLRENKPKGIIVKPIIKITDELLVNEIDMGILLGNIVDNAIEATERLETEKRIPIEVRIICNEGVVSINVRNAVDHEVDTDNLYTIKKDKLIHGHGVKQIKKTVARYDGTAEFRCESNVFTVTTTMVNRPRYSR